MKFNEILCKKKLETVNGQLKGSRFHLNTKTTKITEINQKYFHPAGWNTKMHLKEKKKEETSRVVVVKLLKNGGVVSARQLSGHFSKQQEDVRAAVSISSPTVKPPPPPKKKMFRLLHLQG